MIHFTMQYPMDLDKIREALHHSYEKFWETIMDLVIFAMEKPFEKFIGPEYRRVGVYGPYTEKGRHIIDRISKVVCENDYAVVTGYGYLLPDSCDKWHPIEKLFPPVVEEIMRKFLIPDFIKFQHFPRLVSRAIHYLEPIRTQRNEVEGCFRYGIPMIGLVIHPEVGKDNKNLCNYIQDFEFYQECMCPDKLLCFYPQLKPKCPFYDHANIPWATKQLFMTKVNRLVALQKEVHVDNVIIEYLTNKMVKPTFLDES